MELVLYKVAPLILMSWIVLVSAERSSYIVHMDKSFMPKAFSTQHHWYSSMAQSLQISSNAAGKLRTEALSEHELVSAERSSYILHMDKSFQGFSAVLSEHELGALKESPGFLSAYADSLITPDTTHTCKFLPLNTATGRAPASQCGKDAIIGVVDRVLARESEFS